MPANYVLLATQTVGNGGAASVTFANIPQTGYTDLKVVASARGDNADDYFGLTFNGSSSSFTSKSIQGNGSAASSASRSDNYFVGTVVQSSLTANTFSNFEIVIPNYTSSANKSFSLDSVQENNATSALSELIAGLWSNTAAITSIGFVKASGNFAAGSTFYLYGLAAVGTTPAIAPFASGGDVIANDGTYWYHAFKNSGTFTPNKALSCSVLVVAGGGGGGKYRGGGGGAGGLVYDPALSITSAKVISIGAGGAGAPGSGSQQGTSGTNSVFDTVSNTYIATGGGGGGGFQNSSQKNGLDGGSGGGAGQYSTSGTVGATTQNTYSGKGFGNAGGLADASTGAGGGGGGSGAAGGAGASSGVAGNGGVGKDYSAFATATGTGGSGYYAGGGGGGGAGGANGTGGTGGGGAGGGVSGTVNSGGGGGGENRDTAGTGSGGSGIVIIRYAMA